MSQASHAASKGRRRALSVQANVVRLRHTVAVLATIIGGTICRDWREQRDCQPRNGGRGGAVVGEAETTPAKNVGALAARAIVGGAKANDGADLKWSERDYNEPR